MSFRNSPKKWTRLEEVLPNYKEARQRASLAKIRKGCEKNSEPQVGRFYQEEQKDRLLCNDDDDRVASPNHRWGSHPLR